MTFHDRGTSWFLAQLKPNCANIADRNLKRQGFKTFLPMEEETRQRNGKFVTSMQPLFPGYIFVAFDVARGFWRAPSRRVARAPGPLGRFRPRTTSAKTAVPTNSGSTGR